MALLYYRNLGVHRPDILMRRAFGELKTFYDFLKRTRDYLEGDTAVKRLAWRAGEAPADGRHDPGRDAGTDAGRGSSSPSRRIGRTSRRPRSASSSTRT